jgi:hypothetical protein
VRRVGLRLAGGQANHPLIFGMTAVGALLITLTTLIFDLSCTGWIRACAPAQKRPPALTRGVARLGFALMASTAGYSGTPLPKKLGFKPGMRAAFVNAPADFAATLGELPDDVAVAPRLGGRKDLVLVFLTERAELERRVEALKRAIAPDGMVWVAWPKTASKVRTDITEDVVREVVLPTGLVDVKVCAIDATWSGLKLVIRKELR